MIVKVISCAKTPSSTKPRSNSTSSSIGEEPCSAILASRGICSKAPREGYTRLPIPSASVETQYAWSRGEQNRTSGSSGVASSSFSSSAGSSYTIYADANRLGFSLHRFQRIQLSQQGVRRIQHIEGLRASFCVAGNHWSKVPSCVPSPCLGLPIDSSPNWYKKSYYLLMISSNSSYLVASLALSVSTTSNQIIPT